MIIIILYFPKFITKVLNIYIYEGSENPFLITRVYSTKWLCSYDMLFYPFDTQVVTSFTINHCLWKYSHKYNYYAVITTMTLPIKELSDDVGSLWELSKPGTQQSSIFSDLSSISYFWLSLCLIMNNHCVLASLSTFYKFQTVKHIKWKKC